MKLNVESKSNPWLLGESLYTRLTMPVEASVSGRISLYEAARYYVYFSDIDNLNEGNLYEASWLASLGQKALQKASRGFGTMVGWAKSFGGMIGDGWKKIKGLSKKAAKKLKKLGGKAGELFNKAFFWLLEKIPGGETAFEFLAEWGKTAVDKLKEMGKAIGDKLTEWAKTAKVKMITMLLKALKRGDEEIHGILKSMDLDKPVVEARRKELKALGITTISEYNLVMQTKELLNEVGLGDVAKQAATEKVGELADGAKESAEMVVAIAGDPSKATDYMEDPEEFMRGAAADGVNWILTKVLDLMEHDFKMVVELFGSTIWEPFKTGFGQAAAAMMGILSSPNLAWDKMAKYVQTLIKGFKIGGGRTKKGRAVQQLFLTNKGELFKDFFTGIIKGSNLEQVLRAVSGDPKSIKKLIVSITGAIVGGLKAAANKYGGKLTDWFGEQLDDDDEESNGGLAEMILNAIGRADLAEA